MFPHLLYTINKVSRNSKWLFFFKLIFSSYDCFTGRGFMGLLMLPLQMCLLYIGESFDILKIYCSNNLTKLCKQQFLPCKVFLLIHNCLCFAFILSYAISSSHSSCHAIFGSMPSLDLPHIFVLSIFSFCSASISYILKASSSFSSDLYMNFI